jgi:hypothetical protein
MWNLSTVLYATVRNIQRVFCVAGLLDVERTTTLRGNWSCRPLYSAQLTSLSELFNTKYDMHSNCEKNPTYF